MFAIMSTISTCLIFGAGFFSSKTENEQTSFYSANVVKKNTVSGNILGLAVGEKKNNKKLPECFTEFHNLYGVFKEKTMTFAPIINANKEKNIEIFESDEILDNHLSILYSGALGSIEYKDSYKHYILPIQLMFEDDKSSYDISRYVINISKTQASALLEKRGFKKNNNGDFSKEEYFSLIRSECTLKYNQSYEKFCINNIFLEENYYFEGLKETIGDFIMSSYYLPWNLRANQENCYFLNNDSFQNKYIFDYINSVYGKEDYSICLIKNNITDYVDENLLLSFNNDSIKKGNAFSYVLLIFAIFISAFSVVVLLLSNKSTLYISLIHLFYLLPYFIFFVLFKVLNNLFLFSSFSCSWYLIICCCSFFVTFIYSFLSKTMQKKKETCLYEEISI